MLRFIISFLFLVTANADLFVALKQHNTDILLQAFHDVSDPTSPHYGQYWSQDKINNLVSPPQKQVDDLISHFKIQDVDCEQIGADALVCKQLNLLCLPNYNKLVDFIEVPANRLEHLHIKRSHSVGDGDGYVAREVILQLYNITYNSVSNSSVCAVEYQNVGGISNSDLEIQQKLNNQKTKPIVHIVGTNQSPMMEAQLDVQMMSQVADNADVWMWSGEQWLYSFAVKFLNQTTVPDVLSMSWGWSARQQCDSGLGPCPGNMSSSQYLHRVNMEYVKMGLRGVTVTVSSGDAGAPGRTNEDCSLSGADPVNPAFPGSSPYVTSVSATYVVPQQTTNSWKSNLCQQYGCVDGNAELPCNFNATGWTTGGGFAIFNETRTSWQKNAVLQYLNSSAKKPKHFQRNGRGYPDVAAIGHNCPTIMDGQIMPVDGTSCSSPIFAAIIALLNDHQKNNGKPNLGFVNPVLYQMWADNKNIFHDITKGNNWCTEMQCCNNTFGYESAVGWDPVTGLGTPNFGLMMEWLDQNTMRQK
jgi:subtilase family serine protease